MIDEVSEVKRYLNGEGLDDSQNYYRACYMVTKYYKKFGLTQKEIFQKVSEWVANVGLKLSFSLMGCVSAAYANDLDLRSGKTVRVSQADAEHIREYSRNREDRRVALALLCCAKCFADKDGAFTVSSGALGSWLGMDSGNLRNRQIQHLMQYGFIERLDDRDAFRGWKKSYYRHAYRYRLLVPYSAGGKWVLEQNDIRKLYEQVFGEPYKKLSVNG